MRTFATQRSSYRAAINPLTGLPRSRTLASFHRGALPLQSSHRLSRPDLRRADSPSFRRPLGIRMRAPSPHEVGQVVRDRPRVRPRVVSTPRRFSQAHVPRLYFAPQPGGLSVVEHSPRRDRAPVPRPLCSLEVPHSRAERDPQDLIAAGFPSPPHTLPKELLGARQPSSPANYGLPFPWPKPTSRLSWVSQTVIARCASSASFEALIPLRVRSRDLGLPLHHGRYSSLVPFRDSPPSPRNLKPATPLRPKPRRV